MQHRKDWTWEHEHRLDLDKEEFKALQRIAQVYLDVTLCADPSDEEVARGYATEQLAEKILAIK